MDIGIEQDEGGIGSFLKCPVGERMQQLEKLENEDTTLPPNELPLAPGLPIEIRYANYGAKLCQQLNPRLRRSKRILSNAFVEGGTPSVLILGKSDPLAPLGPAIAWKHSSS